MLVRPPLFIGGQQQVFPHIAHVACAEAMSGAAMATIMTARAMMAPIRRSMTRRTPSMEARC
jgi:hypothetical protein